MREGALAALLSFAVTAARAPAPASPDAGGEVSVDHRQVAFLMRALGHDQRLRERAGADVTIAVLGRAGDGASEQLARAMTLAFAAAAGAARLQGLPVRAFQLRYLDAGAVAQDVQRLGVDVLYICPGLDAELDTLLQLTRQRRALSIAGKQDYLPRGASLGVFPLDGGLTIFVNLGASRKEGAAFGSNLLRVARVLR
jgi:hypothetical protein